MMEVEGKCSADAVARGLPVCTQAGEKEKGENSRVQKQGIVLGRRAEDPKEEAEWGRSSVSGTKRLPSKFKKIQCNKLN